MRYWVYINEKVEGPYEENDLVTIPGFTPETLLCTEESASSGEQEWKKADTIFEFDEVAAEDSSQMVRPLGEQAVPSLPVTPIVDTAALLNKLDSLSNEVSSLQSKLDSMQSHLDVALEQNKQLVQQAAQVAAQAAVHPVAVSPKEDTAPVPEETPVFDESSASNSGEYPSQAAPEAEEVIIRSALDSIYGGKPVENTHAVDDSVQDLLPHKESKSAENIEEELEFIPLQEESDTEQAAVADLKKAEIQAPLDEFADLHPEALITTPSLDEAAKDALISELTASPKEDILDQIIQEHQQEEQAPAPETAASHEPEEADASVSGVALGLAAGGMAVAGAAVASMLPKDEPTSSAAEPLDLPLEEIPAAQPLQIAPDKNNPDQLEPVLPAQEMPQDVPAVAQVSEESAENPVDLPGLNEEALPQDTPSLPAEEPAEKLADLPGLDELDHPQNVGEMSEESSSDVQTDGIEELVVHADQSSEEIAPIHPEEEHANGQEEPAVAAENFVQDLIAQPEISAAEEPVAEPETTPQSEPAPQAAEEPALELETNPAEESGVEPASETAPVTADQPQEEPSAELAEPAHTEEDFASKQELPVAEEMPLMQDLPEAASVAQADASSLPSADQNENDLFKPLDSDNLAAALADAGEEVAKTEIFQAGNPNDLTEIELKEGSTYLISDFVPPAQLTDDVAAIMNSTSQNAEEEQEGSKKVPFQDMMATTVKQQSVSSLPTDGLPEDVAATSINLENTIQAKRGASLDIKTVPMVPEPGQDNRLDMNDLNDVNSQHDFKTSGTLSRGTKAVIGSLVGLLLLLVVYVLLGLTHLLPDSVNLLGRKKAQPVAQQAPSQELLAPVEIPAQPQEPAQPSAAEQAQFRVQQFPLPNGQKLQSFIESKHGAVAPETIEWSSVESVEADNYSVSVKVPPENPQSLQTAYRFNYNMVTGMLNPTNSDAKNLLDQAYGKVQTAQAQTPQTAAQKTVTKQTTAKTAKGKTAAKSTATRRATTTRKQ